MYPPIANDEPENSQATGIVLDPSAGRLNRRLYRYADKTPRTNQSGTISVETEKQYMERVRSLQRTGRASRTIDWQNPVEPDPMDLVDDLIASVTAPKDSKPRSLSSWRIYRAALLFFLARNRHLHAEFDMAYQKLASMKHPDIRGPKVARRQKMTFVSDDLAQLINHLLIRSRRSAKSGKASWGDRTAYWLQAGIATGARACEWPTVYWQDRENCILSIKTAKQKVSEPAFRRAKTANSVHGVHAAIDPLEFGWGDGVTTAAIDTPGDIHPEPRRLLTIEGKDALYIDLHLNSIALHAQAQGERGIDEATAFKRYARMAEVTLKSACKDLFGGQRAYTLRHTRSHFAASQKVDHDLSTVASQMGHTSTRTTMSHYGSRASGLRNRGMKPDQTQRDDHQADSGDNDQDGLQS